MHISVFDLDHTLIDGNSSFQFCRFLCQKKVFSKTLLFSSWKYYIQHKFLGLTLLDLHKRVFQTLLKGLSFSLLEKHIEAFVDFCLAKNLYHPAFAELRRAQHLGHYTMILSNSPSFLVKAIAQKLGVNEWKATEYEVDKEGKLCHIASILNGEQKAEHMLERMHTLDLTKEDLTAYSDSYLDLPLLENAGSVIVVNPDRKLRKISLLHNWPVI